MLTVVQIRILFFTNYSLVIFRLFSIWNIRIITIFANGYFAIDIFKLKFHCGMSFPTAKSDPFSKKFKIRNRIYFNVFFCVLEGVDWWKYWGSKNLPIHSLLRLTSLTLKTTTFFKPFIKTIMVFSLFKKTVVLLTIINFKNVPKFCWSCLS